MQFAQIIFGFFAEIGLKVEGRAIYFSNPSLFLHLLETFQCGLDIRHGIVGIFKNKIGTIVGNS